MHGGRYVGKLMKNKIVCDINNISNIFVVSVGIKNGRMSCGPTRLRMGTHVLVPLLSSSTGSTSGVGF